MVGRPAGRARSPRSAGRSSRGGRRPRGGAGAVRSASLAVSTGVVAPGVTVIDAADGAANVASKLVASVGDDGSGSGPSGVVGGGTGDVGVDAGLKTVPGRSTASTVDPAGASAPIAKAIEMPSAETVPGACP